MAQLQFDFAEELITVYVNPTDQQDQFHITNTCSIVGVPRRCDGTGQREDALRHRLAFTLEWIIWCRQKG